MSLSTTIAAHASRQHSTRGVPIVKRATHKREHVQRGDSRECDVHVMSAGFAAMCQTSHPHARDCERRGVERLQLQMLLITIEHGIARPTCRLYHDLGVGCGCRRA